MKVWTRINQRKRKRNWSCWTRFDRIYCWLTRMFFFFFWFWSGFYECVGSNSAGETIQTAQLIYAGRFSFWHKQKNKQRCFSLSFWKELPVVFANQSHVLAAPGEMIELICHVFDQTSSDIRWLKDGQPVRKSSMKVQFVEQLFRLLVIQRTLKDICWLAEWRKRKTLEITLVSYKTQSDRHQQLFV